MHPVGLTPIPAEKTAEESLPSPQTEATASQNRNRRYLGTPEHHTNAAKAFHLEPVLLLLHIYHLRVYHYTFNQHNNAVSDSG